MTRSSSTAEEEKEPLVTGESAPLMSKDRSAIRLQDDSHVLARKASTEQQHQRFPSDWTWTRNNMSKRRARLPTRAADILRTRRRRAKFMTKLLIRSCYLLVILYTCLILIGPLVLSYQDPSDWCAIDDEKGEEKRGLMQSGDGWDVNAGDKEYANPDYITDPCRYFRIPQLAWLTLEECDFSRRMLTSVILGGAIGYERRAADRPAGIRTMGLVSLGACFFTISSITAFKSSTMGWDASRVTAALPSGVGFLGAALIWKGSVVLGDEEMHQVHGLTTAASLWLSAAIGVGAGGALYVVSIYSTALIILVLRFGPKFLWLHGDNESEKDDTEEEEEENEKSPLFDAAEYLHSTENSLHTVRTQDSLTGPERRVIFEAGFPQALTTEDTPSLASVKSGYFEASIGSARQGVEGPVTSPRGASTIKRRRSSKHLVQPTFHG